ncbi:hypothetical protein B0H11DRAFT_1907787 [Mycena galericulata]|nr:hypothetical protein B0H11DRAFT_1907787 [Mycena galericulata]
MTPTIAHFHHPHPPYTSSSLSMALPPASGAAEPIHTLRGSIIPALKLAKAGVAGIGVPGLEAAVNGVYELANMILTMKGNKKDLAALEKSVGTLAAINVPGATGDLKERLTHLSLQLTARVSECKALASRSRMDRFLRGDEYKGKILDIRDGAADDIRKFTFLGTISIETLVTDIAWKGTKA